MVNNCDTLPIIAAAGDFGATAGRARLTWSYPWVLTKAALALTYSDTGSMAEYVSEGVGGSGWAGSTSSYPIVLTMAAAALAAACDDTLVPR